MNTKLLKSITVLFMAFITFFVNTPLSVFAKNDSKYFYIDGERVSADDERILNIAPVRPSRLRASQPNASEVLGFSAEFERGATVTMDGTKVSAQRYGVVIDSVQYEAFCSNPDLPGPEVAGAVYELTGAGNAQII